MTLADTKGTEAEIARRYGEVIDRIRVACGRTGRDPDAIKVVAVSKTQALESVQAAWNTGIHDFGENRSQELVKKTDAWEGGAVWHFIGHIQTNKVRQVVGRASLIHSVDSLRLAGAIAQEAGKQGICQQVLLQVNVSAEGSKSGFGMKEFSEALLNVKMMETLSIRGLMTIAPLSEDEGEIRRVFAGLRELRDDMIRCHPDLALDLLSMGMTGDFEIAVEEGANLLRIGTAIFGSRA